MSAQSKAKADQDYDPKPDPARCANCGHFQSDMLPPNWMRENDMRRDDPSYHREKNLRCGIGGFAVKKTATCIKWQSTAST